MPTTFEHDLDTAAHLDDSAATETEGSSKAVLDNADAIGGTIELQSELEQKTLIPSAEETGVDVVTSTALTAHEVETGVEADTHGTDAATTSKNDLAAEELPDTEQPVVPTTEVFIFYPFANLLAYQGFTFKGRLYQTCN